MKSRIISAVLGLLGAIVGGVLGHLGFVWIAKQGFYAMVLPGAMLGAGCGLLARHPSYVRGAICGVAALLLGLFSEWTFLGLPPEQSYFEFLSEVGRLERITQILIVVGGMMGFWFGKDAGFDLWPRRWKSSPSTSPE